MDIHARLDNLVLDSVDPEAIVPFWTTILGVEVVDRLNDGQYVELAAQPGGVALIFQRVPEAKTVKNRMHVDIEVADLDEATAEIERLGAGGPAGRTWKRSVIAGERWPTRRATSSASFPRRGSTPDAGTPARSPTPALRPSL